MFWAVFIPFLAAAAAPWVCRLAGRRAGWALAAAPVVSLLCVLSQMTPGTQVVAGVDWVPALDVQLRFALDGLSGTFALLITGIGAFITIYAGSYMAGEARIGSFFLYLLAFMGSMLGLVLADDLISLFVFWELTSITSFLLIGFDHESKASREAAMKALLVTAGGGLALLAGLLLLAIAAVDSGLNWSAAMQLSALRQVDITGHSLYTPAVLLIILGAFTKSAQWPFHFWLPAAMAAPTPVSAYLHSATMVKAGVYLLARLNPMLGDTALWDTMLTTFGAITMVHGAILAAAQTDLKRILAFTTLSVLGTLTMLIGVGSEAAVAAAVVFLVAHALYKAALFLIAGSIDHSTGTRDIRQLGGLRRAMPITATASLLAVASMAGLPPLLGFIGKELIYEALGMPLLVLAIAANALQVAMALVAGGRPFWGPPRSTEHAPHEAPVSMWIGPMLLALGGLAIGLFPGLLAANLGAEMAAAIAGQPVELTLKLWHGLEPHALFILGLSLGTLVIGLVLFATSAHVLRFISAMESRLMGWGPQRGYETALAGLYTLAGLHTRIVQHGYLRFYLIAVLGALIVLSIGPAGLAFTADRGVWDGVHLQELIALGMIIVGSFATINSRAWLTGIVWLGVVGVGVTLIYVLFGAPDLAITQIMVETLTVILFVLIFYHLPPSKQRATVLRRGCDALVAIAVGCTMGLLVLAARTVELPYPMKDFYATRSVPEAHGSNVVNVILVDFRALDTLGEITVVAVAGVGVYALLKLLPLKRHDSTERQESL